MRAKKRDTAEILIVEAIRSSGWMVWRLDQPCDLLCWQPATSRWQPLEVKSGRQKSGNTLKDKRQSDQIKFLDLTRCPVVTTPEEALRALK